MNVLHQDIAEKYAMYHGDCCEVIKGIPENSVGYIIFSPPFSSLYTYSNYNEDMGNSNGDDEFYKHFEYLVPELYRVLKPGRSLSFHCMDLPTSKEKDGFIGLKDFPGELLRFFEKVGFIFHSRVTIWKDPLIAATRTKALGLLHKQIVKDSYICRQGIADYLITVRKRGENQEPIAHPHGLTEYYGENEPQIPKNNIKYSHMVWRQYASPVWDDIRQTYTLNTQGAKDQNDEKHICPLQLDVIARGITLWSNKNDVVLSPFGGIASEGYQAIKMGRKFIGIELKDSYYNQAVLNLKKASELTTDISLF